MTGSIDLAVTLLGIAYGVVLIWASFAQNVFTEAMRIDALLFQSPSKSTRPLNLVIGVAVAGYCIHSLVTG